MVLGLFSCVKKINRQIISRHYFLTAWSAVGFRTYKHKFGPKLTHFVAASANDRPIVRQCNDAWNVIKKKC